MNQMLLVERGNNLPMGLGNIEIGQSNLGKRLCWETKV